MGKKGVCEKTHREIDKAKLRVQGPWVNIGPASLTGSF